MIEDQHQHIQYITFKLTKEEIESDLWKKLQSYFEGRLSVARKENDPIRPENNTNLTRGKILAYKEFIELGHTEEDQ